MIVDALKLAFGTFSVLPVRTGRVDRRVAAGAMLCAPLPGVVLGVTAALVLGITNAMAGEIVAATLAIGILTVLTRGLHLDGLADLADGLGSGRPGEEALAVMKRPDIGPFGVVTLVLMLLLQIGAVAELSRRGQGEAALVVATVTGRLAITVGCRRGVPPARPEGLGALVAGTVPVGAAVAVAAAVLGVVGLLQGRLAVAVAAGLVVAFTVERHAHRRLGGVTGDVLGALGEVAFTAALLASLVMTG